MIQSRLRGVERLDFNNNVGIFTTEGNLTFFYSKTNQAHNISNLFYFATTLYMFQTVFPSIIRSLRLYIQHQVYVQS
jgi:hypothetical protein